MTVAESRWYVVQTHAHSEGKAAEHLRRQGFDAYLPRYRKKRRHARRVETVSAPLFPRYLFVAVDVATQRWRSIRSTVGVTQLICNGDRPTAVSGAVVEQLRSREDERGLIKLDQRPQFAAGEKIRVVAGVFESCFGLFEGMNDGERVSVLLDLLGRKVRVLLDDAVIAAA